MYNTEPTAIAPGGVALSTEDPATSPTALGSVSDGELSAMRQAVALSRLSLGETSPNPNVGCVLLDERGEVVGQGRTAPVGGPHAEVNALAQAGQRARGGTAVVTLEPCDHTGRTGPCTGALLASGVRRVVYAVADPNPVAAGGATTLRAAGVEVVSGVLEPDARAAMLPWLTSVSRGRPFVVWRFATTLDGRIAARDGTSKWITSAAARAEVPDLLAEVDAVIASAGTVRADDPQLTARYPDGSLRPRQPLRVVLAGAGGTPRNAKVTDSAAPTWIVEAGPTGRVDLHELMKGLYDRGVRYALVEGDPTLAGALLGAGLVDRVIAYRAPAPLGAGPAALDDVAISTIGDALRFDLADVTMVGPDVGLVASPRSKAEHPVFTGIIEEIGTVAEVVPVGGSARLAIHGPLVTTDAAHGDSISVDGVCLTVVDTTDGVFTCDVMRESLDRSTLGALRPGDAVNLERAATLGSRMGGHLVQGHVDGVGALVSREPGAAWELMRFTLPEQLAGYVAEKGSITIDGVSLTVVDVTGKDFAVGLIPTTLAVTTLGVKDLGDTVNLEVDVIAKYVEKLLENGVAR